MLLQAQRDLDVAVGRDHTEEIERNEAHHVGGNRTVLVGGNQATNVLGDVVTGVAGRLAVAVKSDETTTVGGDRVQTVTGGASMRVGGDRTARVDGRAREEIAGRAEMTAEDDAILRVRGHLVAVVGQHDARRSATLHVEGGSEIYATGVTEIVADKGLVLRVGKSSIRMTPTAIELSAETVVVRGANVYQMADEKLKLIARKEGLFASDKKLFFEAEHGSIALTRDARIDGDMVKINCSPDPVDPSVPEARSLKPTKFSLVDEQGKPMAGQRLVLVMPDGSERTAILDEDGKAELELEDSGQVVFPDVSKPQTA